MLATDAQTSRRRRIEVFGPALARPMRVRPPARRTIIPVFGAGAVVAPVATVIAAVFCGEPTPYRYDNESGGCASARHARSETECTATPHTDRLTHNIKTPVSCRYNSPRCQSLKSRCNRDLRLEPPCVLPCPALLAAVLELAWTVFRFIIPCVN